MYLHQPEPLEKLKEALAEIRIKWATDYCWTYKYGKLHVLCNAVWVESIKEQATKCQVEIDEILTYN